MSIYGDINKIVADLRDRIAVARNDAKRHEALANENMYMARQKLAEAMAYEGTLERLNDIEMPQ